MARKMALNIGSGQRKFLSTDEVEWINVDAVSRPDCEPDLVCDGKSLPYETASVDYVVLHHVLEHFGCGEADDMVDEAYRVLKHGGSLIVTVPNLRAMAERWCMGQFDTQLFLTSLYGAYMGDPEDRHKWGYDNITLHESLSRMPWDKVGYFNGRNIPGADIAHDWWILEAECVRGQDEHVLILAYNNLELTKRTVDSVSKQNIPTRVHIIDNGSTDGTVEWAKENKILMHAFPSNFGVSAGWNRGLSCLFSDLTCNRVFVINNDVVLPPFFMRELISYPEPFVTGIAVDNLETIKELGARQPLQPHPDFSAYMIRREAWQKIGYFDDRMKLYASDTDYHVRGHRLGVGMWKANIPYYHERSSTLRKASEQDRMAIQTQANQDRAVFRSLYNCVPGEPAYQEMFK